MHRFIRCDVHFEIGDLGRIRTCDLVLRRHLL